MTPKLPRPHEGIVGTARGDGLLDMDDRATAQRLRLVALAGALYSAASVGNPAPKVEALEARMQDPRIGDLVMEVGTPYRRNPDRQMKGFGILLAHREEQVPADESDPDDPSTDHAWYIQYGPAAEDVCRWTDCRFVAVPGEGVWGLL